FVVVNLRTNRIYELNSTASILWELLEAGSEDSELESRMLERVDVAPDELRREIDGTMRVMREAGLVTAA
ncbi:MAG: PqqD family protein, partial [Thermoleophilaceae bacterium]